MGIVLLLIDQRPSLSDAALDQFGLNLELLVGPQIDHSFKWQVPRQRYSNIVATRCEQHGFSRAVELADISRELIVHEYGRDNKRLFYKNKFGNTLSAEVSW